MPQDGFPAGYGQQAGPGSTYGHPAGSLPGQRGACDPAPGQAHGDATPVGHPGHGIPGEGGASRPALGGQHQLHQHPHHQHPHHQHPYPQYQPIGYEPGAVPQDQWGYPYRPMPAYPQPTFAPTPRRPGALVPAWVWVLASTAVVLVAALGLLIGTPDRHEAETLPAPSPTFPAPTDPALDPGDPSPDPGDDPAHDVEDPGQPNSSSSGTFSSEVLIAHLNTALGEQDTYR